MQKTGWTTKAVVNSSMPRRFVFSLYTSLYLFAPLCSRQLSVCYLILLLDYWLSRLNRLMDVSSHISAAKTRCSGVSSVLFIPWSCIHALGHTLTPFSPCAISSLAGSRFRSQLAWLPVVQVWLWYVLFTRENWWYDCCHSRAQKSISTCVSAGQCPTFCVNMLPIAMLYTE